MSWNPTSVYNDGTSIHFSRWISGEKFFERILTTFIAIKRIDNFVTFGTSVWVILRNQYFLGVVELSQNEIWSEPMVHIVFFLGHSPPGEVQLLPWSDIA